MKTYGVPFVPTDNTAETEALEGKAGLSAVGGVDSDKLWDDEVEPMELDTGSESQEVIDSGFADIEIKDGENLQDSGEVMEEDSSLEELAGLPPTSANEAETPAPKQEAAPMQPPEAPPVPAEGLPEGWTMDQWKWYGAEWLAKQGK